MSALQIVQLVNMVLNLAANAGINLARLNAMRELNGGSLSDEQLEQLAQEAKDAVGKL